MPGWKFIQSKRQTAKKTKLAVITLVIVLALLLLSQAVKLTQTMFSPWKIYSNKTYLWNGDFNLNFLVRGKETSLVSFNPQDQKVVIINIPPSTFLEVAHDFGRWQLSSIYDLAEGQKGMGGKLLEDSLSSFFGLPIDGFLDFSGKFSNMETVGLIEELKGNPFSLLDILPDLRSDLTPYELIRLKIGLSGVRFDKIKELNLEKAGVLEKTKLADGSLVYTGEDQKVDSVIFELTDPQIRAEHKTVAVFNATNHPQLAGKVARMITNIGGDVIITSNFENELEKTIISGEQSETLKRLWQIFGKGGKIDPELKEQFSSRAQINLFLGEDFLRL